MAAPALPRPPDQYNKLYFFELLRVLRLYFVGQVDQINPVLKAFSSSQTVTATTAALGTSDAGVILVNTTSNNVAVTLPAASTTLMYQFIIKRISAGANTLTINTVSGNIDGSATKSIPTQYDSVTIRSDGTNYWLV